MGKTLVEFITDKIDDPRLRDELLAELKWRGMDRDVGLIFEDSIEEIDAPNRAPQVGSRVQYRRNRKDKRRFEVVSISGGKAQLAPLRETPERRGWEPDPDGAVEHAKLADLLTVMNHTDKVFPGLVSTGAVGEVVDAPSHIAIRGENLHVLRALNYTHAGAVDLIYIDPPYNTGTKDWIYNDKRIDSNDAYRHSKWLAFMYRRLELAKSLLKDTGVIIVAIGDDEHHRLRMLMDDVFGESNFISDVVWQGGRKNDSRFISNGADYMLVYARSTPDLAGQDVRWREEKPGVQEALGKAKELWEQNSGDHEAATRQWRAWLREFKKRPEITDAVSRYTSLDDRTGEPIFTGRDVSWPGGGGPRYDVLHPITGKPVQVPKTGWRYKLEDMSRLLAEKRIRFGPDENSGVQGISYLSEMDRWVAGSVFDVDRRRAAQHLDSVLGERRFPFPKDQEVLVRWISLVAPREATIVDFFGGSGSTLEAVIRLNERDGGTRQCIIATSNELGEQDETRLEKLGHAPGDPEWEARGVYEYVLRPRIETILTGVRTDGTTYDRALAGNHRVEFFTLDYMDDQGAIDTLIDYDLMAPLLWARAGGRGAIPPRPRVGDPYVIGETFAILFDLDQVTELIAGIRDKPELRLVFVVADNAAAYRQAASDINKTAGRDMKTVHLERTYLADRAWLPRDRRRSAR